MNAPFDLRMDKSAFCRWLERQDGKYEWTGGRVVQMTNVTKAHARIVANVLRVFSTNLDLDKWSITASDLGVETKDSVRFPDLLVEPLDTDDKGRRATEPVILLEVLSPSSAGTDFTEKLAEYTSLPSLEAYIVASQDEPICWLWQRGPDGAFPRLPEEIKGRDAAIALTARAISLPLADIYRGIGTP